MGKHHSFIISNVWDIKLHRCPHYLIETQSRAAELGFIIFEHGHLDLEAKAS